MSVATPVASALADNYDVLRRDVEEMLRREFGDAFDDASREALAHQAMAELLALERRGEAVESVPGLLQWRARARARDKLERGPQWQSLDTLEEDRPGEGAAVVDERTAPEPRVEELLDVALARQVLATLRPLERAVLKLRFDLGFEPDEICERLSISRRQYKRTLNVALKRVEELAVDVRSGAWSERHRPLIVACLSGTATPAEVRRAQELVAADPACRAMVLDYRRAMRSAGALLPLPAAVDPQPLLAPVMELAERVKQGFAALAGRAPGADATAQLGASGGPRGGAGLALLGCAATAAVGGALVVGTGVLDDGDRPSRPRAEAPHPSDPHRTPVRRGRASRAPKTARPAARRNAHQSAASDRRGSASASARLPPPPRARRARAASDAAPRSSSEAPSSPSPRASSPSAPAPSPEFDPEGERSILPTPRPASSPPEFDVP